MKRQPKTYISQNRNILLSFERFFRDRMNDDACSVFEYLHLNYSPMTAVRVTIIGQYAWVHAGRVEDGEFLSRAYCSINLRGEDSLKENFPRIYSQLTSK